MTEIKNKTIKEKFDELVVKIIDDGMLCDEDMLFEIQKMLEAKETPEKPPKRIIRETINTTAQDNVHFNLEFNVPTDVFGAMMVAASEFLMPLQNTADFDMAKQLQLLGLWIKMTESKNNSEVQEENEVEEDASTERKPE